MPLAARIDDLLPQAQCTRCGYPARMDYANAITTGETQINQCTPGGAAGIAAFKELCDSGRSGLKAGGLERFIREFSALATRIDARKIDAMVEASKENLQATALPSGLRPPSPAAQGKERPSPAEADTDAAIVGIDDFAKLAPRKMRFGMSQGMILSAGSGGSDLHLLDVDSGAKAGMPVK